MKRLIAAAVMLIPQWAMAAEDANCAPVSVFSAALAKQYGEALAFLGADEDHEIAIFVNQQSGTFTLLAVKGDGVACMLLGGEHWRALKVKPTEPGDPS